MAEQTYLVRWEINIFDAESPEDAARKALEIQRRPESTATIFDVTGPDRVSHHIDLLELQED